MRPAGPHARPWFETLLTMRDERVKISVQSQGARFARRDPRRGIERFNNVESNSDRDGRDNSGHDNLKVAIHCRLTLIPA